MLKITNLHREMLKDKVRTLMSQKQFHSFAELAENMGVTPSSLSRHLNHDDLINPRSELTQKLANSLGVPVQDLMTGEVDTRRLPDSYLSPMEQQRLKDLGDMSSSYLNERQRAILSLKSGDSSSFCGCTLPLEFDFNSMSFRRSISEALQKGVRFRYIFPGPDFLSALAAEGGEDAKSLRYRFQGMVQSPDDFTDAFEFFKKTLQDDNEIPTDVLDSQISLIPSCDTILLNPLFSVNCFEEPNENPPEHRVFLNVKAGSTHLLESRPFWFPAEKRQAEMILDRLQQLRTGK